MRRAGPAQKARLSAAAMPAADIIILDLNAPHAAPTEHVDVVSRIVYEGAATDVDTTIIDGRVLMLGRRLLAIDEAEVVREANRAVARMLEGSGCAAAGGH